MSDTTLRADVAPRRSSPDDLRAPAGASAAGPAANHVLRRLNRSAVLDTIRGGGTMSRLDISRATGLSKPTVCTIVDQLIRDDAVVELPNAPATGRGRPPRLLAFNETASAFLGIEFGSTTVRVAVADGRGSLLAVRALSLAGDPRTAVAEASAALRQLVADAGVSSSALRAVGVAAAGLIDRSRGEVVTASSRGWGAVPLGRMVEDELGLPASVINRVAAATLAEGRTGAASDTASYVWVYSGTGIGAGLVVDGVLVSGTSGFAGELGHSPVADDGRLCACGNRGCLETVAGAAAIAAGAAAAVAAGEVTTLSAMAPPLAAADVARAAVDGDAVAAHLLAAAGAALGLGVAHLVNILNPSLVVIGGPLATSATYLDAVCASVARHTLAAEQVPVVRSALGGEATLRGAVQVVLEEQAPSYRIVELTAPA